MSVRTTLIAIIQLWLINLTVEQEGAVPQITALNVQCDRMGMRVNVNFDTPFNGIIFSKGHYADLGCRYMAPNAGTTTAEFAIPVDKCGTNTMDIDGEDGTPPKRGFENIVVFQNDPTYQEVFDHARMVVCRYTLDDDFDLKEKRVVFRPVVIDMLDVVSIPVVDRDGTSSRVDCWMEITKGRFPATSPIDTAVKVGSPLTLAIFVRDPRKRTDLRVKDCYAYDDPQVAESNGPALLQLTDFDGCPTKPKLIEVWKRTHDAGPTGATIIAFTTVTAFKFPDRPDLQLTCNIELCRNQCAQRCSSELPGPVSIGTWTTEIEDGTSGGPPAGGASTTSAPEQTTEGAEEPADGGDSETPANGGNGETPADGGNGETPADNGDASTEAPAAGGDDAPAEGGGETEGGNGSTEATEAPSEPESDSDSENGSESSTASSDSDAEEKSEGGSESEGEDSEKEEVTSAAPSGGDGETEAEGNGDESEENSETAASSTAAPAEAEVKEEAENESDTEAKEEEEKEETEATEATASSEATEAPAEDTEETNEAKDADESEEKEPTAEEKEEKEETESNEETSNEEDNEEDNEEAESKAKIKAIPSKPTKAAKTSKEPAKAKAKPTTTTTTTTTTPSTTTTKKAKATKKAAKAKAAPKSKATTVRPKPPKSAAQIRPSDAINSIVEQVHWSTSTLRPLRELMDFTPKAKTTTKSKKNSIKSTTKKMTTTTTTTTTTTAAPTTTKSSKKSKKSSKKSATTAKPTNQVRKARAPSSSHPDEFPHLHIQEDAKRALPTRRPNPYYKLESISQMKSTTISVPFSQNRSVVMTEALPPNSSTSTTNTPQVYRLSHRNFQLNRGPAPLPQRSTNDNPLLLRRQSLRREDLRSSDILDEPQMEGFQQFRRFQAMRLRPVHHRVVRSVDLRDGDNKQVFLQTRIHSAIQVI